MRVFRGTCLESNFDRKSFGPCLGVFGFLLVLLGSYMAMFTTWAHNSIETGLQRMVKECENYIDQCPVNLAQGIEFREDPDWVFSQEERDHLHRVSLWAVWTIFIAVYYLMVHHALSVSSKKRHIQELQEKLRSYVPDEDSSHDERDVDRNMNRDEEEQADQPQSEQSVNHEPIRFPRHPAELSDFRRQLYAGWWRWIRDKDAIEKGLEWKYCWIVRLVAHCLMAGLYLYFQIRVLQTTFPAEAYANRLVDMIGIYAFLVFLVHLAFWVVWLTMFVVEGMVEYRRKRSMAGVNMA